MYILEPIIHETIWGGNRLHRYIDDKKRKVGHLYLVNGHEGMSNIILNGQDKGHTLQEVFLKNREKWDMKEFSEFPLTIALVDATENLSIQVHPDDETAERLEQKRIGKKESWLFLEAPKSEWIYGGCKCDSAEELNEMLSKGRMQEITAHLPICQYDCACVEAGTLHAMTEGSLVYEIEYGSDFTYRFYDYGRKDSNGNQRELHTEKAVKSIKLQKIPSVTASKKEIWISEDVYEICWKENISDYMNHGNEIECITVLDGAGNNSGVHVKGGMSFLLMPGEEIRDVQFKNIIIARLVR